MVGEIVGVLNLPHVSAIPVNQGSVISAGSGVEEWLEEVEAEESGAASSVLKEQIMESVSMQEDGKLTFKTELLRNYQGHGLEQILPNTLKEIY
jgi:hypothetical protein